MSNIKFNLPSLTTLSKQLFLASNVKILDCKMKKKLLQKYTQAQSFNPRIYLSTFCKLLFCFH